MAARDVAAAVADAHRREWGLVLAATVRVTRDLEVAEECVQEAYVEALRAWAVEGVPRRPGAWLTTVARRRALDVVRRGARYERLLPALVVEQVSRDAGDAVGAGNDEGAVPDDRLRLVFTCCHPALPPEARIALTLRLLCGLTTAEVARAFLVPEPTMAARITRAKKKIAVARIPFAIPTEVDLPARTGTVVEVIRLVHTTGHTAPTGDTLTRPDLAERALELAELLHRLRPADPQAAALLALLLLHRARAATRVDAAGRLVLLADQDRRRWDTAGIARGAELVTAALRRRPVPPIALEAAIAAVHATAPTFPETDWAEIVALYTVLLRTTSSPVVALNRAVAVGFASGPAAGLALLDELAGDPRLAGYPYLAASRADLLRRLGRTGEARTAYTEALHLTTNEVERAFLDDRLVHLGGASPEPGR